MKRAQKIRDLYLDLFHADNDAMIDKIVATLIILGEDNPQVPDYDTYMCDLLGYRKDEDGYYV